MGHHTISNKTGFNTHTASPHRDTSIKAYTHVRRQHTDILKHTKTLSLQFGKRNSIKSKRVGQKLIVGEGARLGFD